MDDVERYDRYVEAGQSPPDEEPPPEVWDDLPAAEPGEREYEDPREELGYMAPEQRAQPLATALEQATTRAEAAKEYCVHHTTQIVRPLYAKCPRCEGEANRRRGEALNVVIRELKNGNANPERERQLVKALHSLQHPDPKGLLDAIAARRSGGSSRSRL